MSSTNYLRSQIRKFEINIILKVEKLTKKKELNIFCLLF
jgi:hypothetical protein